VPSPTITGGFYTMGQGRFVHPARRSTLTAHEAARIQFFPDWFDWRATNTRSSISQAIGNAVPPKLSYIFGLAFLR
jgi:DNA (cytosine-5)-methyltransferase 1